MIGISDEINTIAEYVKGLDAEQLMMFSSTVCSQLNDIVSVAAVQSICLNRGRELKVKPEISRIFTAFNKKQNNEHREQVRQYNEVVYESDLMPYVSVNANGEPMNTINNYKSIMTRDEWYSDVRFNTLANYAERHELDPIKHTINIRRWTDADESESKERIEMQYGIYSDKKHYDALRILFKMRAYNPIIDILESLTWDGVERCEQFLTKWALADDTPYVHECSRLIFAGGIWRIMQPGCKMDDVVVLVGGQGTGKSGLSRFLAIHDDYFGEIKTIDGKEATEQLAGKWICEIQELAAFTKAKEVEAIKAFITRQKDNYRKPFDRNVDDRPRMCIMIATTNNPAFLTDATGGRRFYPVQVHSDGYEVYAHEQEIREYIIQCWAEALVKYRNGEMPNFAKKELVPEYRAMQDRATQDDWRVGVIENYLFDKDIGDSVCVKELFDNVLSPDKDHPINPTPRDSKDIGIIMSRMEGWKKDIHKHYTAKYGSQWSWVKEEEPTNIDRTERTEKSGLPF